MKAKDLIDILRQHPEADVRIGYEVHEDMAEMGFDYEKLIERVYFHDEHFTLADDSLFLHESYRVEKPQDVPHLSLVHLCGPLWEPAERPSIESKQNKQQLRRSSDGT